MSSARELATLRVLVAEDHDFQRRLLVRMLGNLGVLHIVEAADGRAALDLFQDPAQAVDIIISDLDMPQMDGMEFIRHVGATGRPVSMILSSALDAGLVGAVETMTRAYGIHLLGAIEKPATPAKLAALIRRHQPPPSVRPPVRASIISAQEVLGGLARGEFEPFLQPQVALSDGRLVGFEALARWRHPVWGVVGPASFIGVLEASANIDLLTWQMIERTTAIAAELQLAGHEIAASVNLSLGALAGSQLAEKIMGLVQHSAVDPSNLVLEVTESTAMSDDPRAIEDLARLRMKGFGLSIDDYGTGYSSMQQLARIPFTELKIDRSFVTGASRNAQLRVMLQSSLEMGRRQGLRSVAEGVETRADWDLVRALRCDVAQGWLIARPMEAAQFLTWARQWSPPS